MNNLFSKINELADKYQVVIFALSLIVLCYFFYFKGLGQYALIDIDETRYVKIAKTMMQNKDYITPYLNFEPFLEKPPLFYWLTILSYKIFGAVNNFTSRFAVALLGFLGVMGTYLFVFNIKKSAQTAFISAVILMSAFWYALFAHIAILDLGFCVLTMYAFYFGISTLYCKKEITKKILWYLAYLTIALCVLQKGLIGIIVPCLSLFVSFLLFKKAKEIFKPAYIIPGVLIFLLIAAPWHYLVFKANGVEWFNEYIVKHHFARFLDSSMGLGRKKPFWFYLPVILGGFMPWTLFLINSLVLCEKKIRKNVSDDLIIISLCWFFCIFIFFSISSTKLPTYILPAFAPLAIIMGNMFGDYFENKYEKSFNACFLITFLMFLVAGIVGIILRLNGTISIGASLAASFVYFAIIGLFAFFNKSKIWQFGMVLAFSLSLFGMSQAEILGFVTKNGQEEIVEYAKIAEKNNAEGFITLGFSRKYSIMHYYTKKPVHYVVDIEREGFYDRLADAVKETGKNNVYFVTKNKKEYDWSKIPSSVEIQKGERYTLHKFQ